MKYIVKPTPEEVIRNIQMELPWARNREWWSVYIDKETYHGLYTKNDARAVGKQLTNY